MSKRDRDRDMNRDGHRDGGTDATKPWKQTLALLHSKRELHTPEKERQASESSTKSSADRDRELDALAFVDPAVTLFGGSTPSSKVHPSQSGPVTPHQLQQPFNRGGSTPDDYFPGEDGGGVSDSTSFSSSRHSQHAPVWDTSLFHPSPMTHNTKSIGSSGGRCGRGSTSLVHTATPGEGIIDIDFRRQQHRGSEDDRPGDKSRSRGYDNEFHHRHHDLRGLNNSDGYGDDDVNMMTPTREPGSRRNSHHDEPRCQEVDDSFCCQEDSYSSYNDEVSGESKSSTSLNEPAETSFNIDEGRALFQSSLASDTDQLSVADQSTSMSLQVNQVLNFGASVDTMPAVGMGMGKGGEGDGQYFDNSTSFLSSASSHSSVAETDTAAGGGGGGVHDTPADDQEDYTISTTETIRLHKEEVLAAKNAALKSPNHGSVSDVCMTPEKTSMPKPKSDVSPETAVLKQMEQAGEMKSLVNANKLHYTVTSTPAARANTDNLQPSSFHMSSPVSPTRQRNDSDFAQRLQTHSKVVSQGRNQDQRKVNEDMSPQSNDETTPVKTANPSLIEHTLTTPSSNQPHIKPAMVPESPFVVERGTNLAKSKAKSQADAGDEWREAKTPQGKTYFYNRRTRVSAWKLPSNAIYIRAGETSFRIFVPTISDSNSTPIKSEGLPSEIAIKTEESDKSSSEVSHKDGMKSAQKSVAPYYNTPPRAKRQPVQTDAHISSSKGQSTGGVTTPPRRRTNSSDSSPKTAHYSPTRGLMSTPQTHHIQKRPMSASPGVAFMKRTATVEQQTGLRQIKMSSTLDGHGHSQGQPHLEETKANNQQTSNQHDSPGGLKGRSLVTPCRNQDTPPRGGIKAHTTSKLELKSADLPSLATERLGVESFDMLEHGIVLPTPLSKVHESSQQSKNMLQECDSDVMFHTSSDLLVHCPMCGETVSAADDQPAHGGGPSLEFTSKYMNNHMLECTTGKGQLRKMSKLLLLLYTAVNDTIKQIDGDEQPLPSSSVTIDRNQCSIVTHEPRSRLNSSPHPETSIGSLVSLVKCDNGEGVENEDGHHRAEGGGEVLSSNYEQSYNIQEDVCSRHHPRGDLMIRDPTQLQGGSTYSQLYRNRVSASPVPATSGRPTPSPARGRRDEREILSATGGGSVEQIQATPSPSDQHRGHVFATPPVDHTRRQHAPSQSCGKEPNQVIESRAVPEREQGRAHSQFVCPCCQLSSLQSREQLLSHMRSCVTYSDTEADVTPRRDKSLASTIDVVPQGRSGGTGTGTDTFGGHGHAKAVCPFCGKPSTKSALSSHLLSCQKRKASQERRMQPTKPLVSQSHKEQNPLSTPSSKGGLNRKKTPLGSINSNQQRRSPSGGSINNVDDAASVRSGSSARSQSSRISTLSQASTVAKTKEYTSPMTQRMHAAIQASRQQQYQPQQSSVRGTSPYLRRGTPSPSHLKGVENKGKRRPVIAAFR